jgi:tetratricopeptide (TPR) repeat protein
VIKKSTWAILVPGAFFLGANFLHAHLKYSFLLSLGYFAFLFFLFQVLKTIDLHRHLSYLAGGISLVVFSYGLFQKFVTFPYLLSTFENQNHTHLSASILEIVRKGRIFSIFTLPTLYAIICSILLIYIFHLLLIRKQTRIRFFWGILFLAGLVNLIMTQSFGGILYFAAGVTCYLLLTHRLRQRYFPLILMGLVLIFSLTIALRFPEARDLEPVRLRLTSWNQSVRIIQDYPLLGAGLGNFGEVVSRYVQPGEAKSIYVHNFFLQLLAEAGPFLFILILLAFFFHLPKNWFWEVTPQRAAYISILISLTLYNLIDIGLYFFSAGLTFVVILSQLSYSPPSRSMAKKVHVGIAAGLGILLLFVNWSQNLYHQGNLARNRNEIREALTYYRQSRRLNPFNYRAWYESASCHFERREFQRARLLLQRSLDINPHYPSANFLQSVLLARDKDFHRALLFARKARRNYPAQGKYHQWVQQLEMVVEKNLPSSDS